MISPWIASTPSGISAPPTTRPRRRSDRRRAGPMQATTASHAHTATSPSKPDCFSEIARPPATPDHSQLVHRSWRVARTASATVSAANAPASSSPLAAKPFQRGHAGDRRAGDRRGPAGGDPGQPAHRAAGGPHQAHPEDDRQDADADGMTAVEPIGEPVQHEQALRAIDPHVAVQARPVRPAARHAGVAALVGGHRLREHRQAQPDGDGERHGQRRRPGASPLHRAAFYHRVTDVGVPSRNRLLES